jgi:hypothetical protein
MTSIQRSVLALIAFASFGFCVMFSWLCLDYYFFSGYGLIGFMSIPAAIAMYYISSQATYAAVYGRFPFEE